MDSVLFTFVSGYVFGIGQRLLGGGFKLWG